MRQRRGDAQAEIDQRDGAEISPDFLADGFGESQRARARFAAGERRAHAREQRRPAEQEEQRERNDRETFDEGFRERERGAFAGHRRDDRRLAGDDRVALRELPGALRDGVDPFEHLAQRLSRGSILRIVCGARASHSVAGVQIALIAAAAAANTTNMTIATAKPRRMLQRCRASTAGVSSNARNSAIATGMNTSCARYSTAPTARNDSRGSLCGAWYQLGGVGVLTARMSGIRRRTSRHARSRRRESRDEK